jgi:hypothetical protein
MEEVIGFGLLALMVITALVLVSRDWLNQRKIYLNMKMRLS